MHLHLIVIAHVELWILYIFLSNIVYVLYIMHVCVCTMYILHVVGYVFGCVEKHRVQHSEMDYLWILMHEYPYERHYYINPNRTTFMLVVTSLPGII